MRYHPDPVRPRPDGHHRAVARPARGHQGRHLGHGTRPGLSDESEILMTDRPKAISKGRFGSQRIDSQPKIQPGH